MGPLQMPEGGLEIASLQCLLGLFHFLFVRFVTSVLLVGANATCARCGELSAALAGGDSGMRPSVETGPAGVRTRA